MPRTIRFHLDEHVDPAIAAGLRLRGIDVTTTPEVGLTSAPDKAQIEFCRTSGRILVTFDKDFLVYAATQTNHAGIAFHIQANAQIGRVIRSLELVWELLDADEMTGRVEYLQ